MEKQEEDLYKRAAAIYMECGIKNITMDQMARQLKVAKKTLYKYVDNRPELVARCMEWKLSSDTKEIEEILAKKLNAVEELFEIRNFYCNNLLTIHSSVYPDLKRYYHEAWDFYSKYRKSELFHVLVSNIKRGMKEGLYREDFNVEIVAKLYLSKLEIIFDATIFPVWEFSFSEVYREMVNYHFSGIASNSGLQEMNRLNKISVVSSQKQLISDLARRASV